MARTALLIGALCVAALPMGTGAAVAAEGAGAPGSSWRAPEVVSPGVGVFAPRVAANGGGSAVAAWLPYVSAPRPQAAFRWFGGPWEPAENLPAGVKWPAAIAMDGAGNVLVHWVADRQLRMTLRPAATGRWSPVETVATGGLARGKIVLAPNGALIAAWTRGTGANRRVETAVRPAGAAEWSEPRLMAGPASVGGSDVQVDRTGTALASWRHDRRTSFARRPPGGPWGAAETAPSLGPPAAPRLDVGPSGDLLELLTGGPQAIISARRPGGAWEAPSSVPVVRELISVRLDGYGGLTALGADLVPKTPPGSGFEHRVVVAHRPAGGAWSPFRRVSEAGGWGASPDAAVNPAGAAAVRWSTVQAQAIGISAAVRPSSGVAFGPPETLVAPRGGIGESGVRIDDAGRALAYWVQDLKLMTSDRSLGRPGAVRLTAGQLRTNQRIAQAAVRSANALTARLQAGLTGGDIRDGALGAISFAAGVRIEGRATGAVVPPGAPAATPSVAGGGGGRVALSAAQLLVNQRISQAAMRRANAIRAMLAAGLTGGNFADGTIAAAQIAPGFAITRAVAGGEVPGTPLVISEAPRKPRAKVALTPAQLLVNQRISQTAVRRLNALAERLEAGLTAGEIRPGTITAADLAPELRG
jgi:hypothetical protein